MLDAAGWSLCAPAARQGRQRVEPVALAGSRLIRIPSRRYTSARVRRTVGRAVEGAESPGAQNQTDSRD